MNDKYTGSLSPELQSQALLLHHQGHSVRSIAKHMDASYGVVRGFMEWLLDDSELQAIVPQDIPSLKEVGLVEPPPGPAILIYDIETAPARNFTWSAYQTNIIDVDTDWYMLSFGYKWLGQKGGHFVGLLDDPDFFPDTTNDKYVAIRLASLFDRADITVAHNGDKFDVKKGNSRFVFNGYGPPSPHQDIDTLRESKRYFSEYKHTLADLGRLYTRERKLKTIGFELWRECMRGNPEMWAEMEKYNRQDVTTLERLYLKIRPWIGSPGKKAHPNLGLWDLGNLVCPKCGSRDVVRRGWHRTTVSEYPTIQCKSCKGYSRIRERKSQRDGRHVGAL